MKFVAVGAGILLFTFVLIGAGNAHGSVADSGTITLTPMRGFGVSGTAKLTRGSTTYIFVRAGNLDNGALYGFALMTAQCASVRQMLNPIGADLAGDGTSASQTDAPGAGWWLGILSQNVATAAVVACGSPASGGSGTPSAPTTRPTKTPPSGGGTVVPVATPTYVPTPVPGSTPHPPGS